MKPVIGKNCSTLGKTEMFDVITERMYLHLRDKADKRQFVAMVKCTHCGEKVHMKALMPRFTCPQCNKENGR